MAKLLLIDDEAAVRRALRMTLELAGHDVIEAADGVDGLERFGSEGFDVVITDIMMPRMDGLELVSALRDRFPGARIIAVTGIRCVGGIDFCKEVLRRGADEALLKPIPTFELLGRVRALADGGACVPGRVTAG